MCRRNRLDHYKMSAHWYLDGTLVEQGTPGALPSVTTILDVRAKPGLDRWRKMVGEEAADKKMIESQELGTAVHGLIEAFLNDIKTPYKTELSAWYQGFMNWYEKSKPENCVSELFVTSNHGYAGTIDLVCEIDGDMWIIDFKTGSIKPEHGLQLAAYAEAWAEHNDWVRPRRGILQLTPDLKRGWRFKEFDDNNDFGVFMAHKEIFDWQLAHNPIKPPAKWDGGVIYAS